MITLFRHVFDKADENGLTVKLVGVTPDRFDVLDADGNPVLQSKSLGQINKEMGWLRDSDRVWDEFLKRRPGLIP